MTKEYLWRLKLHAGNWKEWPRVLSTRLVSYLQGAVDEGSDGYLDDFILQNRSCVSESSKG